MLKYIHHPGTAEPAASVLDQAPQPRMVTTKDNNAPPMSVPASAADIYTLTADPATVPPPSPPQVLLQAIIPETSEPKLMGPPTTAQVPLTLRFRTSNRRIAALSGRYGCSNCALQFH